jgi:hypothetical protein
MVLPCWRWRLEQSEVGSSSFSMRKAWKVRMKRLFYAKSAMRGACTESPRERRNTVGAYLVQAPESHVLTLGEGRAVPPAYSPNA